MDYLHSTFSDFVRWHSLTANNRKAAEYCPFVGSAEHKRGSFFYLIIYSRGLKPKLPGGQKGFLELFRLYLNRTIKMDKKKREMERIQKGPWVGLEP